MSIHVDTLSYANDLEKAGIERAHAEAIAKPQARAIDDLVSHELVTKDDFRVGMAQLEARFDGKLTQLEARFDAKLSQQDARFDSKLTTMEGRLREEIRNESTALRRISMA